MTTTQFTTMGPSSFMERYIVPYTDLTAVGTTMTIKLKDMPKGTIVKGVRIKHTTAFAGGNTTATVSVGSTAGAATTFTGTFDVYQAVADTTALMVGGWKAATYAADTLNAYFTVSTGCSALTAGVVLIDVEYWFEPDLTACGPVGNQPASGASGGGFI